MLNTVMTDTPPERMPYVVVRQKPASGHASEAAKWITTAIMLVLCVVAGVLL